MKRQRVRKNKKNNMTVSMREATLGIKKSYSLQGCLGKWIACEARKMAKLNGLEK